LSNYAPRVLKSALGSSSFNLSFMEEKGDLILIQAVLGNEQGAWDRFVQRFSDLVYSYCSSVFSEPELDAEYLTVFRYLQSDDHALLRAYNGRAEFSTYLNLKLRELLAGRILALFTENPGRAWEAFQLYFKELLEPLKRRSEDLYQDVCVQLIDNNYRRIVGFDGRGSFAGYIRRVIDNLCLDLRRQSEGRRRLPEAVQRLPALDQEIYRQLYWNGSRKKDLPDILRDERGNPYGPERIEQALAKLQDTPLRQIDSPVRELSLVSVASDGEEERDLPDATYAPETLLLNAEEGRSDERHYSALKEALNGLPTELYLYVRLRFYSDPSKSPKEIARVMGRSEREIYRIRQQAISVLKMALKERGGEKNPNLSV
jgi:RNA polymerase primary sigma factor